MGRRIIIRQSRQENLIYLALWALLFASPILSLYVRTANNVNILFDWNEVFIVWRKFTVYLFLFVIHNFILAPLLVHKLKRMLYFSIVAVIIIAFSVHQCSNRPKGPERPDVMERPEGPAPSNQSPNIPQKWEPPHFRGKHRPPHNIGEHDILAIVVLMLMFGANLGIKGYFYSREDRQRLAKLERENLEQQLEYLRYQISPHFFMNTLNNIHALVDIDSEKAKETIVELSKMMRYVLYDGNKRCVRLFSELEFIRHYVALMQLRYTDKVKIKLDLPKETPNRQIPPLILITFIENAFKHGISYQRDSSIIIRVTIENDKLLFTCWNTKSNKPNKEKGGVGLSNVVKRMDLLFEYNYKLNIHDDSDFYNVELEIPLI